MLSWGREERAEIDYCFFFYKSVPSFFFSSVTKGKGRKGDKYNVEMIMRERRDKTTLIIVSYSHSVTSVKRIKISTQERKLEKKIYRRKFGKKNNGPNLVFVTFTRGQKLLLKKKRKIVTP